jgi:hypothetical protein
MTFITLALMRQELETRKREQAAQDDDEEGRSNRPDIHDVVADVTAALAPFLLPLIDSLAQVTAKFEPLSATAGEAA